MVWNLFLGLLCVISINAYVLKYEQKSYESQADPAAVVLSPSGTARFTVLTDSLVRMEFSSNKAFEDRPTLSFVNRKLAVPKFTTNVSNGLLTISTAQFQLSYVDGQQFSSSSLKVLGASGGAFKYWDAGMSSSSDPGNLLGTFRTLDGQQNTNVNCSQVQTDHCVFGLISRSGWALVDDSDTPVLDTDDWWTDNNGNLYPRSGNKDLYLFAHGHNYKAALSDYSSVGGSVTLVPRYITGNWFTRWYNYDGQDTRQIVDDYVTRQIPLDVWVYDMNWHQKNDWTGYTLDPSLFPYPDDAFGFLKEKQLAVSGNLHDASGMHNYEAQYSAFCAQIGVDPSKTQNVGLNLSNKTYIQALEDVVLGALEKTGFDFWWIDWQQGEGGFGTKGGKMNPTIWTNKIRVTDPKRRFVQSSSSGSYKRGSVFARFGGLGAHRYQVGFSGDVNGLTWSNLAYQPYFTSTASNVLFGFWSHDIVGPTEQNLELFVRWIQWGAYSGVMRSHDRGMSSGDCYNFPTIEGSCPIVEPFNVPRKYFQANRDVLQQRAALIPYIYTQYRIAYDTGVSIIRPMYYDYPELDLSYATDRFGNYTQYMFGEDMIVAPVVSQSDSRTLTTKAVFVPPGVWIERQSGTVLSSPSSGRSFTKDFDLSEVPVYVAAGAVIPEKPCCEQLTGGARQQYTTLIFSIFPGENSGSGRVYEDDGETSGFLNNEYAWTELTYTRSVDGSGTETVSCTIQTTGAYASLPATRDVIVKLVNSGLPSSATVNSNAAEWAYYGNEVTATVYAIGVSTSQPINIQVVIPKPPVQSLSGIRGAIYRATLAKRNLDEVRATPGSITGQPRPGEISRLAMLGDSLAFNYKNPSVFNSLLSNFSTNLAAAVAELHILQSYKSPQLVQLWSIPRQTHALCASENCVESYQGFEKLRTEGFMASPYHPRAVKLVVSKNSENVTVIKAKENTRSSNMVIESSENEAFIGYVISASAGHSDSDLIPLSLYRHPTTSDALAVASVDGVRYAQKNGYVLVNPTIGYVYKNQPASGLGNVNSDRLSYSVGLMTYPTSETSSDAISHEENVNSRSKFSSNRLSPI